MHEALRADYIGKLVDGLSHIGPGAMFERFGAKFLDHHLDVKLNHRGLNVQLNPIGGTIDSYNDAGTVGAEYSIDKDYFGGSMTKASGDLVHVLRKHPGATDIYLLSSQPEPPGRGPEFKNSVAQWPGFLERTIHIYDARRIAEVIVDHLLHSDAAIADLAEHLPVLSNIIDDAAANMAVPGVQEQHIDRPNVDALIADALDARPVAVLSGIGGVGKSEAAAAFAAAHANEYHTLMWLDAGKLAGIEELSSVPLRRGGESRNLAAMLSKRKCLLILDDASDAIAADKLVPLCGPGTHIIVTRRGQLPGDLVLPMLSEAEARAILSQGLTDPCPQDVFDRLYFTVGGHPLSLALVNRVVDEGTTWHDVAADCASIPGLTVGDQRLADVLLGRLAVAVGGELQTFEWAGQASCDLRLLREAIGPLGVAKLRKHGLTRPDRPTTVRLHDIIYASVVAQHWLSPERASALDDQLEAVIEKLMGEESLALRVLASTMMPKLQALAATDSRPAFIVALFEIWKPEETLPALIPDPAEAAARLARLGRAPRPIEVRAVLESIEGLQRYERNVSDLDTVRARLKQRLPVFQTLSQLVDIPSRSQTEVQHHLGKALKLLDRSDEAREIFENILAGPHPLHATRLQLVRIYSKASDSDKAATQASEILAAASVEGAVSSNVVLATLQALPSSDGGWGQRLFENHADLIEREIQAAAAGGADDTFSAFAAVARYWSWHDPDRLRRVFDALDMEDPALLDDRARAARGQLYAEVAKTSKDDGARFRDEALRYYEAMKAPDDFTVQRHGQLLVEMEKFADAEGILTRIAKPQSFAFYWLSKARQGQGELDKALADVDRALADLQPRHANFRPAFLVQRFEVRLAMADRNAREDLEEAYAECQDPKYKLVLEKRLLET